MFACNQSESGQSQKRKKGGFLCSSVCKASQDLSLPDVTAKRGLLARTLPETPASCLFFPYTFPFPFSLFSLSLSSFPSHTPHFFFSSLFSTSSCFLTQAARTREVLHQLSTSRERSSGSWIPPPFLSLPFSVSCCSPPFFFPRVFFSPPLVVREHTCLVLAALRSDSNNPTGPVRHFTISSSNLSGF